MNISYLQPLTYASDAYLAHITFVFEAIRNNPQGMTFEGDAHDLFTIFLDFRMMGITLYNAPFDRHNAPKLVTNSCEGNADVAFYREGYRFALVTTQATGRENIVTLSIVYDPSAQYASEDI